MATRTAYYKCVLGAYKIFEADGVTEIATYKTHEIHGNNLERQVSDEGTWDDEAMTFTWPNGDIIYL